MEINNTIASRLRAAREQAGLSQGQVARIMSMHRPTISEMEAGRRRISAEELAKLAQLYGVSVAWVTDQGETESHSARIELAARKLAKLKSEDFSRVIDLLTSLRDEEDESGE